GVVLMCLLQVAKRTDEQLSNFTETKRRPTNEISNC
ncbi:DUF3789 domain-containing protein, partial [Dialister invisus]